MCSYTHHWLSQINISMQTVLCSSTSLSFYSSLSSTNTPSHTHTLFLVTSFCHLIAYAFLAFALIEIANWMRYICVSLDLCEKVPQCGLEIFCQTSEGGFIESNRSQWLWGLFSPQWRHQHPERVPSGTNRDRLHKLESGSNASLPSSLTRSYPSLFSLVIKCL